MPSDKVNNTELILEEDLLNIEALIGRFFVEFSLVENRLVMLLSQISGLCFQHVELFCREVGFQKTFDLSEKFFISYFGTAKNKHPNEIEEIKELRAIFKSLEKDIHKIGEWRNEIAHSLFLLNSEVVKSRGLISRLNKTDINPSVTLSRFYNSEQLEERIKGLRLNLTKTFKEIVVCGQKISASKLIQEIIKSMKQINSKT